MDNRQTIKGVTCGIGAGALWGLVFLAPELAHDFSPLDLTIGRYLAYGLISAALIAPRRRTLFASVGPREWRALAWLALAGNIAYFVLLSSAVQIGGVTMTSLVIGFLPVTVTIIGSRDADAVPLRRLAPSLLLCGGGALCIGWQALTGSDGARGGMTGLLCAIGALVCWTGFAVGNSRCLARLPAVSAHDWNLLTGIVTGAQSAMMIPIAVVIDRTAHAGVAWLHLACICVGVAALASIGGNALWNRMNQLLPLTMVGQMILFETLFALLYGFAWERRLPTIWEGAAFALVVAGVLSCIAAHRTPARSAIGAVA